MVQTLALYLRLCLLFNLMYLRFLVLIGNSWCLLWCWFPVLIVCNAETLDMELIVIYIVSFILLSCVDCLQCHHYFFFAGSGNM